MSELLSKDPVTELLDDPLFRELEPAARQRLQDAVWAEELAAGQIIFQEGDHPERVCFLQRGEVAATQGGALVRMFHPPSELGLLSIVDGRAFTSTLTTFAASRLVSLPRAVLQTLADESPAFRRNLVDHFATEVRRLNESNSELRRSLDDFFESPNARVVPGPYVADPFEMYFFVLAHDSRRLDAILPPGVRPIPGLHGRYILSFSFFDRVHSLHPAGLGKVFRYNETTLFVPCLGPNHRPSVFAPELYPDSHLAITLGRELYGFPKRFGQTERTNRHINLLLSRRLVLRASWKDEGEVRIRDFITEALQALGGDKTLLHPLAEAAGGLMESTNHDGTRDFWPSVPVFVHRQVPDMKHGDPSALAIDELIEVPFRITSLGRFERLQRAEVDFFDDGFFLGGRALVGFRYRIGFEFGRAKHWASFVEEDGEDATLAKRLRGWWRGA